MGAAVTATEPSLMQFWEVSLFQPCVLVHSLRSAHGPMPGEWSYGVIPGLFCKGLFPQLLSVQVHLHSDTGAVLEQSCPCVTFGHEVIQLATEVPDLDVYFALWGHHSPVVWSGV